MAAEFPLKIETESAVAPPHRTRYGEEEGGQVSGRKREGGASAGAMSWQRHKDAAIGRKRIKIED